MVYLFSCFSTALRLCRSSYLSFALLRIATLRLLTKHKLAEFSEARRGTLHQFAALLVCVSECVGGVGAPPHCCDTLVGGARSVIFIVCSES